MNKIFFILIHLACFLTIWTGISWQAAVFCLACYLVRMFAITGGYHRLFSHRSYKTSRAFQFILGFLGATSAQKGPLWWAASHRHHHRHSDTELDLHSPEARGFWWAHIGWVLSPEHDDADLGLVKDLTKLPELQFLEKYHFVPPLLFLAFTYVFGLAYTALFPSPYVNAWQFFAMGGFVSTVALYHGTFAINSLAHLLGSRRYKTDDTSKNSMILALITLGEGWHNNHHRYPSSERQGFFWWEIDITHYTLKFLSFFGLVWDLMPPPKQAFLESNMIGSTE